MTPEARGRINARTDHLLATGRFGHATMGGVIQGLLSLIDYNVPPDPADIATIRALVSELACEPEPPASLALRVSRLESLLTGALRIDHAADCDARGIGGAPVCTCGAVAKVLG